jgi:uncharacterized membrane protein
MLAVALCLIAACFWTSVNYLDKYLLDKIVVNGGVGSLALFSGLIGIPITLCLFLANILTASTLVLSAREVALISASGFIYLVGVIPYLYALESDETSAVVPQMLLTPVFGFMLGNLFLSETINLHQGLGIVCIIWGALSINFHKPNSVRAAAYVFLMMSIFSLTSAVNSTIFKLVAIDSVPIKTILMYEYLGYSLFFLFFYAVHRRYRAEFNSLLKSSGRVVVSLNVIGEILVAVGNITFHLSTLFLPIALAHFLAEGTQPYVALMFGVLITYFFGKKLVIEDVGVSNLGKKVISILLISVGLVIVSINS